MQFWRHLIATYLTPADVARNMKAKMPGEEILLAYLMFASLISFLVRLPGLVKAGGDTESLSSFIGASFAAAMIFAPLFYYVIAALSRVIARFLGGSGAGAGARLALFWPLLALQPLVIANELIKSGAVPAPMHMLISIAMIFYFIYTWMSFLWVMERP